MAENYNTHAKLLQNIVIPRGTGESVSLFVPDRVNQRIFFPKQHRKHMSDNRVCAGLKSKGLSGYVRVQHAFLHHKCT